MVSVSRNFSVISLAWGQRAMLPPALLTQGRKGAPVLTANTAPGQETPEEARSLSAATVVEK